MLVAYVTFFHWALKGYKPECYVPPLHRWLCLGFVMPENRTERKYFGLDFRHTIRPHRRRGIWETRDQENVIGIAIGTPTRDDVQVPHARVAYIPTVQHNAASKLWRQIDIRFWRRCGLGLLWSGRSALTFRKNMLPPSSGYRELCYCDFFSSNISEIPSASIFRNCGLWECLVC